MGLGPTTSALKSAQAGFGAIIDDLANTKTIGHKQRNVYFSSLVVSSSVDSYAPGGVKSKVIQDVAAQGLPEQSSSPTHLSIFGSGFFIVSEDGTSGNIEFTRAGAFNPNQRGELTNAAGKILMGWETDETGSLLPGVSDTDPSVLKPIVVSKVSGIAKASTSLNLQINLPSTDPVGTVHTNIEKVVDSLGAEHNITMTWTKAIVTPATWNLTISCADATTIRKSTDASDFSTTPMAVVFDGNGNPTSFDGVATPPGIDIDWNNAVTNANNSSVTLGLGTVNSANGVTSKAGIFAVKTSVNDGRKFGTFRTIAINETGLVTAIYSNGQSLTLFRTALGEFSAAHNLSAQNGNSWIQSDSSGSLVLSKPKEQGTGKVVSHTLESSTAKVADKIVAMTDLQNFFVSNTKGITAKREMNNSLLSAI